MPSSKPFLSRIRIFPVKSLDGIYVNSAQISPAGHLVHDREFAIIDREGKMVKGKSNEDIFSLRTKVNIDDGLIFFQKEGESSWNRFHLFLERSQINDYLTLYFGFPVELVQDKQGNFLDIPVYSGLTVLSKASLEAVTGWFSILSLEETRNRFRATLELDGVSAFWEDKLFAAPGKAVLFEIGGIRIWGMSPRERCTVPSRDSHRGEILHGFQKQFASHRKNELPPGSLMADYGHYYHLAVDCRIPQTEAGKILSVGAELRIIGDLDPTLEAEDLII